MPTRQSRTKIQLNDALKYQIELHKKRMGVDEDTKAIIDLISKGAQAMLTELQQPRIFTGDEIVLLGYYRDSDSETRKRVSAMLRHSSMEKREARRKAVSNEFNLITVMQLFEEADTATQYEVVSMLERSALQSLSDWKEAVAAQIDEKIPGDKAEDSTG